MAETVHFTLDGLPTTLEAPPMRRLLDILCDDLGLASVREGCGTGACGACAVRVDGRTVVSCLVPVGQIDGCEVTTAEGLTAHAVARQLQEALLESGVEHCRSCAPGLLVGATEALAQGLGSDETALREALSGHICRCSGYAQTIAAVMRAVPEDE